MATSNKSKNLIKHNPDEIAANMKKIDEDKRKILAFVDDSSEKYAFEDIYRCIYQLSLSRQFDFLVMTYSRCQEKIDQVPNEDNRKRMSAFLNDCYDYPIRIGKISTKNK